MNTPLLQIKDLHTDIEIRNGVVRALSGVDLHVNPGETLGIVGESGSGKTMTALSLMGLLPQGGKVSSGSIILDGQDLTKMPLHLKRKMRGTKVGMIFQDPLTSLNPTMKIGLQVCEPLRVHEKLSKREALARAVEILKRVGMPRPEVVINNYPHQLSGGMRQRVMIAMALVCKPRILIADEPTTALDVTTQMQILDLIDELRDEYKMGVILITHDLGVVAGHTDRVAVMYAGRIVETAPTKTLFTEPKHRYTSSLMAALPERALAAGTKLFSIPGAPPSLTNLPKGCRFAARCLWATDECRAGYPDLSGDDNHTFSCFHPVQEGDESPAVLQAMMDSGKAEDAVDATGQISHEILLDVKEASREYESAGSGFFKRDKGVVSAVDRVSITVNKGETYGLVGESGCGKSTVGRLIAGLEPPSGGAIELDGRDLATLKGRDAVRIHRDVQMMFQDSYAAMDPRMRIDQILAEPMSIQKTGNARQIAERIMEILEQVGLTEEVLDRYPHEFSGGQLQRLGFARSLTLAPDLIVADEPVSALDVSVQAQVLNLMKDLQQELGLSYLFISHDLAVVQYMADRIGVMYLGRIVEEGPAHEVVKNPKHPYTKALIDSIPVPDPEFKHDESAIKLTGEPPSAVNPPEGCRFRPRCPFAGEECKVQPMLTDETHRVACHHPLLTLSVKEEVNA
ncbi:ABC transporter ATP-binding protein [Pauljensenia sp. UMB0018B]|uniref:Dipeptide ABC transporter ATP-binding protein n=1 Tax=Schaalia odontolytica TaxID=1660 RepID=A0A2I1HZ40_9ACTO|nr:MULTISPECIES: ABC transporter ATP-binding protein [Actinomycetaceae]EJN45575.1 oligopeptide/dipeptide transporter, C-terminal domain protein [Actinomyces sp. ICM39]MDK7339386.1 ABC transporter ATP-binding protein [Pauljensenia sp. UMB0018B]PKY64150.1 dipeptide ABC transporter ATP-binding protein [Schaalia odontolytica]